MNHMVNCKWCDKEVEQADLDKFGLCTTCFTQISADSVRDFEIMHQHQKVLAQTLDIDIVASSSDSVIKMLRSFMQYEKKGIVILAERAYRVIERVAIKKNARIIELLLDETNSAIANSSEVPAIRLRRDILQAALMRIVMAKALIDDLVPNYDATCAKVREMEVELEISLKDLGKKSQIV